MRQTNALATTVGKKVIIALTGLALFIYLVIHLAGNLLVFLGSSAFNNYSHFLLSKPAFLLPIEFALLLIFLVHIYYTTTMTLANRAARPVGYAQKRMAGSPSRKSLASSTMIYTGLFIIVFVIIHLIGFRFGTHYIEAGTGDVRDLYRTEMEQLHNPLIVGFYSLSMIVLGFHLWHGFWSASQSLGVENPKLSRQLLTLGKSVAVIIAGGFLGIVLWAFFLGGK